MSIGILRLALVVYSFAVLLTCFGNQSTSIIGAMIYSGFNLVPAVVVFVLWQASIVKNATLKKKESEEKHRQEEFFESVQRRCSHKPVISVVIGGSGFELQNNEIVLISCIGENITLSNIKSGKEFFIPFSEIINIEISGPGTVKTNAGLIGGGFGVQGALKGILVASAINALTTKTSTNTFLRVSTSGGEVHLQTTMMVPADLRLVLSPAIVAMEAMKHSTLLTSSSAGSTSDEIKKLHQMHLDGVLTQEEFALAKERVLSGKVS